MDIKTLEKLLKEGESATLDFKQDFYEFSGDTREEKLEKDAKFIKDIISFANTIRLKTSYIITGFDEKNRAITGISSFVDDSRLQEKIKDKVRPIPQFNAYEIEYKGRRLGIVEIPIVKYPGPCKPVRDDLRGLEKDQVYHRRGSSNSKATELEIVDIHNWFRSLTKADEYIGDGRIFPQLSFVEKRYLALVLFLWIILLAVYIPSVIYDFSVFHVVSFPYSVLVTYLSLDFVFSFYFKYFMNQYERNKYRADILYPLIKWILLAFSSLIWCIILSAFVETKMGNLGGFFYACFGLLSGFGLGLGIFCLFMPDNQLDDLPGIFINKAKEDEN